MAISITKPTVGGSEDTWGDEINAALDTIVDAVNGTSGTTAPNLTEGSWQIGGTAVTPSAADLNVLDGLAAQNVSVAEIGHLDGVTSDIQTQLDAKAAKTTTISSGGGLTGGGSLSANRTISHADTSSQSSVNNSGNTVIQDVTLDGYGHVTSLTSKTISTYTAPTSQNSVGTYAFARKSGTVTFGSSYSGSDLRPAGGVADELLDVNTAFASTGSLSGTWRAMGAQPNNNPGGDHPYTFTLFLRIS